MVPLVSHGSDMTAGMVIRNQKRRSDGKAARKRTALSWHEPHELYIYLYFGVPVRKISRKCRSQRAASVHHRPKRSSDIHQLDTGGRLSV